MSWATAILGFYLLGAMASFLPLTRWFVRDGNQNDPVDIALCAVMALFTAPFWPLVLPVWWAVAVIKTDRPAHDKDEVKA